MKLPNQFIKTSLINLALVMAIPVYAQDVPLSVSTEDNSDMNVESNSPWYGWALVTYNDNYQEDYRDDKEVDIDLLVGYQFSDDVSLSIRGGGYYLYNRFCSSHSTDDWCLSPTYIYGKISNIYQWGEFTKLSFKSRLMLPTSEYLRDTKLYVATGFYFPFQFDVARYIDGLSLAITPSIHKYFNEYKTQGGVNLVEYRPELALDMSYQITDKWSFSFNLTDSHYITYKGDNRHPVISHSEELGYQLNQHWYIGGGYSNSAQYYNPDKGTNPVNQLFDDKDPYFYLSALYAY